mmetsp:Transcript_51013/g.111738  ORF Transcript_51013/g.111738 Transcript_51013/m.111738 type:complete len:303 (-) Transcript_51013:523-1431(-)
MHAARIVVLGPVPLQLCCGVLSRPELRVPPVLVAFGLVVVIVLVEAGAAAAAHHLERGDILVLGPFLSQGRLVIPTCLQFDLPPLEVIFPVQIRVAVRRPSTHAGSLALALAGRTGTEDAPVIPSHTAVHRARLKAVAAVGAARGPLPGLPVGDVGCELRLHRSPAGQPRKRVLQHLAGIRLLALQVALRLGARGGLLAIPGAHGLLANVLARQLLGADHVALGLATLGVALRPLAGSFGLVANILRAEHRATGVLAAYGALRKIRVVAPGLALGLGASGLALLIAHRVGALPVTVRHAIPG